jgi:nitrate/nitrite-specific signal transduction histidine kinase
LLNIERHAKASKVTIFLWHDAKSADLLFRDNGIASGSETKPGCYGLITRQERIYTLGDSISIHNVEAEGLATYASIPVEAP